MISAFERQQEHQRYRRNYERVWPRPIIERFMQGEPVPYGPSHEITRRVTRGGEELLMVTPNFVPPGLIY